MKLDGRVVAITGGGSGLGAQACRLARARGASSIAVIDRDGAAAQATADELGATAYQADVTDEKRIAEVVAEIGDIDVWVHNAGIGANTTTFTEDAQWQRMWEVHVMAIVYATRALLPRWLERGSGQFVTVASSNALTSSPVSAAYAATKHAELALTEWLHFTYATRGISATCFCPKGMLTPMLLAAADANDYVRDAVKSAVSMEEAARLLVDLIESGNFLDTTYPPVLEEYKLRAQDPDAYLAMMQNMHDTLVPQVGVVE